MYAVDEKHLLIVTTDRLSAFDVILPDPIPGKGEVLTAVSNFWFARLAHIVPNHLVDIDPQSVVRGEYERAQVHGRGIVVRRLHPLPIEAVVRGYLTGSGWKDYQASGKVCGTALPARLRQAGNCRSRYSRRPPRQTWVPMTRTSTMQPAPSWSAPR